MSVTLLIFNDLRKNLAQPRSLFKKVFIFFNCSELQRNLAAPRSNLAQTLKSVRSKDKAKPRTKPVRIYKGKNDDDA